MICIKSNFFRKGVVLQLDEEDVDKKTQIVTIIITVAILIVASYYINMLINLNGRDDPHTISKPGDFAKVYLQDDKYDEILIEVDFVEGKSPNNSTMDELVKSLSEYCDKSRIYYRLSDPISDRPSGGIYSIGYIYDLEQKYRDYYTENDTAVMYILYVDGFYEESDSTLGLSYLGSSFVIFKDNVDDIEIPMGIRRFVSPSDFEVSVVIHEAGHLLGLVNINYESVAAHEDKEHDSPHHCIYEDCVMYHALESSRRSYMDKLFERTDLQPPKEFCEYCEDDLEKLKDNIY
jgi:hypothetical protein